MLRYFYYLIFLQLTIIIQGLSTVFGFEVTKLFYDHDMCLTKKVAICHDLALKKYDGQKIWLIYAINHCQPMKKLKSNSMSNQPKIILSHLIYGNISQQVTTKKVAIILDYSLESGNPCLYNIHVQKMNQPIDLENRTIFWLGENSQSNSVQWLCQQFHQTKYQHLQQQLMAAIGSHQAPQPVIQLLKQVIRGNYSLALKIDAINWLGQHDSAESVEFLTLLAVTHKNIQLRKKAIFALSQLNNKSAKSVIIALAKKGKNTRIRQEAIFWLSQIADESALNTFNNILASEENSAIKAYTIFAISQLPCNKAAPVLNRIAQNNPDALIRDQARFWLERTRDHRIMDFVRDLTEENQQSGSN